MMPIQPAMSGATSTAAPPLHFGKSYSANELEDILADSFHYDGSLYRPELAGQSTQPSRVHDRVDTTFREGEVVVRHTTGHVRTKTQHLLYRADGSVAQEFYRGNDRVRPYKVKELAPAGTIPTELIERKINHINHVWSVN